MSFVENFLLSDLVSDWDALCANQEGVGRGLEEFCIRIHDKEKQT